MLYSTVCHLNLCIKKWGSLSSFRRKQPVISLNCSTFIENLSSFEGARTRLRPNHAKNDAQEGCAMQLKGITLRACVIIWPPLLRLSLKICVSIVFIVVRQVCTQQKGFHAQQYLSLGLFHEMIHSQCYVMLN